MGRLQSDFVTHCNPEFLLAAEIALSGLYGHVPEEKLDNEEFAAWLISPAEHEV
jgi:hypothetical protein